MTCSWSAVLSYAINIWGKSYEIACNRFSLDDRCRLQRIRICRVPAAHPRGLRQGRHEMG